jgi:hypothetical protein
MTRIQFHAGVAILAASATAAAGGKGPPTTPFEEASIIVEHNATDGDTEVVIEGVAGDEGLQLLRIRSPDGRSVSQRSHAVARPAGTGHDPASGPRIGAAGSERQHRRRRVDVHDG